MGGPIKRDKLWFYTAHRWQGSEVWIPVYYNKLPKDSWFYEPDLSKQANNRSPYVTNAVRLTWQATEKQKLSFHFDNQGGKSAHAWAIEVGKERRACGRP